MTPGAGVAPAPAASGACALDIRPARPILRRMTQTFDADILIIGGGANGAAFALAAAKAGLRSIVLDASPEARRRDPGFDGRAYALAEASMNFLRAVGVWPMVAARAQPFSAIEIYDGRVGDPGPLRLRFDGEALARAPFAALLEDRFLRNALLDAVAAEPLIDHRAPVAVRETDGDGVATLESGERLRAPLIVACDGRRSRIAAAAGVRWTGRDYDQTGLVCAVDCSIPHGGVARQVFYPSGPFAMLPLPGDRVSIVWSERKAEAARIAALDDAAYAAEIAARAGGMLGAVRLAGGRWAYPLILALAYAYVGPRLAALGDAAHAVHPIAGQGLNLGLRDAAALAQVLAEARRRGEDIGAPDVLARYQRWRRFDGAAFGMGMDGLNRLFSTDAGPVRALRDLGLELVDAAPGLKAAFMTAARGAAGDAPRLLRGEAP